MAREIFLSGNSSVVLGGVKESSGQLGLLYSPECGLSRRQACIQYPVSHLSLEGERACLDVWLDYTSRRLERAR